MGSSQSRVSQPMVAGPSSTNRGRIRSAPDAAARPTISATLGSAVQPASYSNAGEESGSSGNVKSLMKRSNSGRLPDTAGARSSLSPSNAEAETRRSRSTSQSTAPFIPSPRDKGKGKEAVPPLERDLEVMPGLARSRSSLMSIFKGGKDKEGREKKRRKLGGVDDRNIIAGGVSGDRGRSPTDQADANAQHEAPSSPRTTPAAPVLTLLSEPNADKSITPLEPFVIPSEAKPSSSAVPVVTPAILDVEMDTIDIANPNGTSSMAMGAEVAHVESESMGRSAVFELAPPVDLSPVAYSTEETLAVPQNIKEPAMTPDDHSRATSPPIIPLTSADPLISDRLSALSAIRDVLGDDVLRNLPAVRTARASLDLERRASRSSLAGPAPGAATTEGSEDGAGVGLLHGAEIPSDTRSLLEDLDQKLGSEPELGAMEAQDAADAAMAVDDDLPPPPRVIQTSETTYQAVSAPLAVAETPLTNTLELPPPMTQLSATTSSPSTRPSLATIGSGTGSGRTASRHSSSLSLSLRNRDREGQLGRVASRLSGWLGLIGAEEGGAGAGTTAAAADSSDPSSRRARSAESMTDPAMRTAGRLSPLISPVSDDASPASTTVDPLRHRIRPGATLIIQGFVQTSMAGSEAEGSAPSRPSSVHGDRNLGGSVTEDSARASSASDVGQAAPGINGLTMRRRQSVGESGARGRPTGLFGRNRDSSSTTPLTPPAFSQQAHMLGGLLSVATAATAASLLTPPGQPSPLSRPAAERTGAARTALNHIRDRIRNGGGSSRSSINDSMDESLRDYMRHAMDPTREWSDTSAESAGSGADGSAPAADGAAGSPPTSRSRLRALLPNTDSEAFETFLDAMQVDLSRQLREYVGEIATGTTGDAATNASTAAAIPSDAMVVDPASIPLPPPDDDEMEVDVALTASSSPPSPLVEPYLLGHNRPGTPYPASMIPDDETEAENDTTPVTAPRLSDRFTPFDDPPAPSTRSPRFNFFRMFQFPAREQLPANGEPVTTDNPMQNLVPVLIIGVRSLNRDISTMAPGDAAESPFMFGDEEDAGTAGTEDNMNSPLRDTSVLSGEAAVPLPSVTPEAASSSPAPTTQSNAEPEAETDRPGGWGSRALRALGRHRRTEESDRRARSSLLSGSASGTGTGSPSEPTTATPASSADASDLSTRNFVLWVFGGHYPPNHPILTIPRLFTDVGGELTHDDLWALAGILGQVKPPTASKEDIEKSGLEVIKGNKIGVAVQEGKVMENCLERCLICLGDYEPEEDCRILGCKHAFHSPCIDRWLEVGRRSCPACRQAGVQTSSAGSGPPESDGTTGPTGTTATAEAAASSSAV